MPVNDRLDSDGATIAEGDAESRKPRKRSLLFIYVAIAVVMAAGGYFVGTKLMHPSEETSAESATEKKTAKKQKRSNEPMEMFMMEDIIVNPSGTGGTRFLSVAIGFEIGSRETVLLFEKREPVIKDALITILGSKTIEQLSDPKEKEITRYQIKKRVEQLLQVDDLAAVYFTDFILQ
ncbi:MAG: flagellar basal body-associated FliL family protein [Candidatus Zixiibacteriota bacterium]|nr:MAG: flagellar basal body-associated FliL family protein [candidate division Zixibacteria bacterium]